jgi:hypothetical protein
MFGSTRTPRTIGIRLALLAVAGLTALAFVAGAARAASVTGTDYYFNFGNPLDNGTLTLGAACDSYAHNGAVSVTFQTPNSTPGGLWVYTKVLVKNRTQTWANALVLDQRQQFVQTVSTINMSMVGPVQINSPKTIVGPKVFYGGAGATYDVAVQFWVAKPGAPWSQQFFVAASQYSQIVDRYGNMLYTTNCQT